MNTHVPKATVRGLNWIAPPNYRDITKLRFPPKGTRIIEGALWGDESEELARNFEKTGSYIRERYSEGDIFFDANELATYLFIDRQFELFSSSSVQDNI